MITKKFTLSPLDIVMIVESYLAANYEGVEYRDLDSDFFRDGKEMSTDFELVCKYEVEEVDQEGDDFSGEDYEGIVLDDPEEDTLEASGKVEKYLKGGYDKKEEPEDDEPDACKECGSEDLQTKTNSITKKSYIKCESCGEIQ